jgi:hypothetical protein
MLNCLFFWCLQAGQQDFEKNRGLMRRRGKVEKIPVGLKLDFNLKAKLTIFRTCLVFENEFLHYQRDPLPPATTFFEPSV